MELLPLKFYSLSQAVDFINQKTNSAIKENFLYSYAIEEKIRFLLQIEIKNNQLIKIGRVYTEAFFITNDLTSSLNLKDDVLEESIPNQLILKDGFSILEIGVDEIECKPMIQSYRGYVVLHPELLEAFVKESIPQTNLPRTNYFNTDSFFVKTPIEASISNTFNFRLKYVNFDEHGLLYERTFRINFDDIKICYDDLISLFPSEQAYQDQAKLKKEIDKLKSELIEKENQITELKHQLDESNLPIMLNEFMKNDRLTLAIQARKKYWRNYSPDLDNAPKADATAKEIQADYNISQKQATAIEIVACPINRK